MKKTHVLLQLGNQLVFSGILNQLRVTYQIYDTPMKAFAKIYEPDRMIAKHIEVKSQFSQIYFEFIGPVCKI